MSGSLKTTFAGVAFKNPVVLASGTCGFGREYNDIFDIERLGGISTKGLTLNPRQGNDGIRVWETECGVMNSVGLENPGVRKFIEDDLDWLNGLDIVNIVNLSGYSIEDYLQGAELLNGVKLDILELNISCPNLKAVGMNFGVKTETAREVVRKIRAICKHKLMVKLSPNAEDVTAVRMAMAAALFVQGAEDPKELAAALNALLPAEFQGPFDDGATLVTLAAEMKPEAYAKMTQITGTKTLLEGSDIVIAVVYPNPPPPQPFNTPIVREPKFHQIPDKPLPPLPPGYNNQCGCRFVVLP